MSRDGSAPAIAAVILAAGASRRLGRPKQDVVLAGETLLERAIRTAAAAGLRPVVAVVDAAREVDWLEAAGATVLRNARAGEGMSTSVQLGVQHVARAGARGLVLLTCDQPLLAPGHLCQLAEDCGRVTGSAYAGRIGVPAYFPAAYFPQLLALTGDQGARELLRQAHAVRNEALALDIDTEADLLEAQRQLL